MNYILVIDHIATGGAERILIDYYHHLISKGHNVTIFCLSGNKNQSKWTEGINVIYGSKEDENNLIRKTIQQINLYFKLKKLSKIQNTDIIFSFLEKSNLLTIAIPTNAKKIVSIHNVLSIQYTKIKSSIIRKLVYKMIQWAYNHCTNVITVSKQVKDDLIDSFKVKSENIRIINNYVDKKAIQVKAQENIDNYIFEKNIRYIINIGRFSDQKAQWKLLKAYKVALDNGLQNTKLILMGHGEYTDELKQLTVDLSISENVDILPFNINPYKYMKKTHLFVLSSIFEGFPIVLAEASSLGIPFVGSRKSIPEEMFDNNLIWEQCIFDISNKNKDFSTSINEDELLLSKLIIKGIEDDTFRQNIKEHTAKWELNNHKSQQFNLYDTI